MQKYNHILQNRAHQNFFFSDTVSFWTINSLRWIHLIINGKVLEHESKAGLFPGSVSLELNSSMSGILQMDVRRRSWKTMNSGWSGLYCFWDSLKHSAVSNPSGLLQMRSENWESGSTLKCREWKWSRVIRQASLASCWKWICSHQHCSLAVLPGKEEPPSGPASSSVVTGSYCGVWFAEKINQLSSVSKTLVCSGTFGLEKKVWNLSQKIIIKNWSSWKCYLFLLWPWKSCPII